MTATIARSPVTAAVVAALETIGKPVGDGVIPDASWIGQPMAPGSTFEPFLVSSELNAGSSWGPFSDPQADWQLPYLVESFGLSREQCSWMADKARGALLDMRNTTLSLGTFTYKVGYVHIDSLGAPVRIDAFQPPFYHSQDGFTVWIGKQGS